MPADTTTFEVKAPFKPTGDQPAAIDALTQRLGTGEKFTCLLGATGTGKTFTMAHTIARLNKPTLILSHNKTLAAQLYEELREFLPDNSVNYFVSYYDYYQPEAYIPQRDIYIEKDASRNDDLDQLRLAATSNILSRRDTVVVASVSCIFGLGSPEAYYNKVLTVTKGSLIDRRGFLMGLNSMQYVRSDIELVRGKYRVRGDVIEIWPASEVFAVRIDTFGDEVDRIELINPVSGELLSEANQVFIFPAVHYVMPEEQMEAALSGIREELDRRLIELRNEGKLLEAQRLQARTKYDLELIAELGFCPGIENYSRFLDGRRPGERPFTLLDYFDYAPPDPNRPSAADRHVTMQTEDGVPLRPTQDSHEHLDSARQYDEKRCNLGDWLLVIDESHVTLPQIRAMFNGDQARKRVLVEHGFRLPSALDNRPLRFEEFESVVPQVLFVSATPGKYELEHTSGEIVEQIIRPTGLLDPEVEVRTAQNQVPNLMEECEKRVANGDRVLVTALTKRLCEDLTRYLDQHGMRVRYLHSEIETLERMDILTDLRAGEFDVLVGVNLLREGLDLPEVSLVCILDADKEGFLRSTTSLIQQMGRAARNVEAKVIMYADKMTPAMQAAIDETQRRRAIQLAYNEEHNITPETIRKSIRRGLEMELRARKAARDAVAMDEEQYDAAELVSQLEAEMLEAAQELDFERAAALRDQAQTLRKGITSGRLQGKKVSRTEAEHATTQSKSKNKPGMAGSRPKAKRKKKKRTGRDTFTKE
ncbi:MAG: excinuclease ABC subunit UvrB [Phycisphaerales bacterium]